MNSNVILDTAVLESLWAGGSGSGWLERVASGDPKPVINAATLADLIGRTPDRQAEIQIMALVELAEIVALDAKIARVAGGIARTLESDEGVALQSAIVAATSIETGIPVACVDDEFFTAMGCEVAALDSDSKAQIQPA